MILPRHPVAIQHIIHRVTLARVVLLGIVLSVAPAGAAIIKVANPQALPVVDNAHLLTADQISSLSIRLKSLATTDGGQVVVLTLPTTGDEDIFSFSQRTATDWGIGQTKDNSGVLFTIASNDHKAQIQVGYGLEGRLTDALSKQILETEVTPSFRKGSYYEGISNGTDSIIAAVKGEYKAKPKPEGSGGDVGFWVIIFVLIVVFVFNMRRGGKGGRGGRGGGGGLPMFLPNFWSTGGGGSGGFGHSGGDSGGGDSGGGFSGGFGGGGFGGGGAGSSW